MSFEMFLGWVLVAALFGLYLGYCAVNPRHERLVDASIEALRELETDIAELRRSGSDSSHLEDVAANLSRVFKTTEDDIANLDRLEVSDDYEFMREGRTYRLNEQSGVMECIPRHGSSYERGSVEEIERWMLLRSTRPLWPSEQDRLDELQRELRPR